MSTATGLLDHVRAILDSAEQEPASGVVLWSFFTKDSPLPLEDEDAIVARIESGKGVFVIEMVFDDDLELVQRSSKKIKKPADLANLKRDRLDALAAPALTRPAKTPLHAPRADAPRRTTLLHGALLDVPSGDKQARPTPKKR